MTTALAYPVLFVLVAVAVTLWLVREERKRG